MYLAAYLDWYSRYVVAWSLSDTLEDYFVVEVLRAALSIAKPEIVNSDQGSQYTGKAHAQALLYASIRISMDGRSFIVVFTGKAR